MINYQQVRDISLSIVKAMVGIDCFAVVQNSVSWGAENLGKAYEDYEANEYWTRDGVDRDSLKKMYPCLVLQSQRETLVPEFGSKGRYNKRFVVRFDLSMPVGSCGKSLREAQTDDYLRCLVTKFIDEFIYSETTAGRKVYQDLSSIEILLNSFGGENYQADKLRGIEFELEFITCINGVTCQ